MAGDNLCKKIQKIMLTSDMWGDILRFVVRAVPRQHNNEKEIQKDFGKVSKISDSSLLLFSAATLISYHDRFRLSTTFLETFLS